MTVIAGWVALKEERPSDRLCAQSLGGLRRYGEFSQILSEDRVTFGSAGSPSVKESKTESGPINQRRYAFVADVSIYNRRELISQLPAGYAQVNRSDHGLLFEAWVHWGEKCVQHVIGDYAFAVYDKYENKLVLVRDPTGQRPLFFTERNGLVGFASLPSGLTHCDGCWNGFNLPLVAAKLLEIGADPLSTYYNGIQSVPPAHIISRTGNQSIRITDYFHPLIREQPSREGSYIEEYRYLLDQAVRSRIESRPGFISTHLSAGLDSSAVAATAATVRGSGSEIYAFTAAPQKNSKVSAPPGHLADESGLASQTARMHCMVHIVVRNQPQPLTLLRSNAQFTQEPFRNVLNSAWGSRILECSSDRNVRVLLNGNLGNLTLNSGGPHILRELFRTGNLTSWWKEVHHTIQKPDLNWRGILINSMGGSIPKDVQNIFASVYYRRKPKLANYVHRSLMRGLNLQNRNDVWVDDIYSARLAAIKRNDSGLFYHGTLAEWGVEEFDPLSDRRLVEFSLQLPPNHMYYNGIAKPLAKSALMDRLPAGVLSNNMRGYQSADWAERLPSKQDEYLLEEISRSPAAQELFNINQIRAEVSSFLKLPPGERYKQNKFMQHVPLALSIGVFLDEVERSVPISESG